MDVNKSLTSGQLDLDPDVIYCLLNAINRNDLLSARTILARYTPRQQGRYLDNLDEYLKLKLSASPIDITKSYKIKETELKLFKLQSILKLQKPSEINFQITNRCNCKCKMCNIWRIDAGKELTCDRFKQLLCDSYFSDVQSVGITGGEPTLREDLFDFYKILPEVLPKFKGASFITNGILTKRVFNVYSKTFDYYHGLGLSFQGAVSLDGLYGVHDNIRGHKGAFSKAIKSLFQLRDYGISTNVCCTIVKDNVYHLQDLLEWCEENKVPVRFRVGEFINRLDNLVETDQIRNFSQEEKRHLIGFFYHLLERYETDPLIRRTYYSILSILSGGDRLIACPYQNGQSINVDSSECFMTCAPKGKMHNFTQDIQSCINNTVLERLNIRLKYCDNCIHDYHSNWLPLEEWKISLKNEVKDKVYTPDAPSLYPEVESSDVDFKSIKRILLVGWYGTETAGDIAILGGIIKEYLNKNPDLEFALFSLFPYYTKTNLGELKKAIPQMKILLYDYLSPEIFEVIESHDAIVMAGGPLMDIPQTSMIASLFKMFSDNNKIRIVEGCGVGPLHNELFLNNVLNIIRTANYVSVRDQKSKQFLRVHGIKKQIFVREDPALTYITDFEIYSMNDKKENVIRCYLRDLTPEYPQTVDSKMAFEHIRIFLKNLLVWYPECRIELWAMHYFPVGNDDRLFNKKLSVLLLDSRVSFIIPPKSIPELLTSMANSRYCICMRYHSILFASSTGVPFIAIDYTDGGKIYGFLSDSDQQNRMATLSNIHLISKEQFEKMAENQPISNFPAPMNIVQISTEEIRGGAAIAAYRLYSGLKLFNPNVRMLVKNKSSANPDIIPIFSSNKELELEKELFSGIVHQECITKNRTDISTTLFSYPILGYDFEKSELLKRTHIINLHWTNFFCSISSLQKIIGMKKPIVWTFHDQWAFTGGCHYTSGCDKYLDNCANCPQLINDKLCLPCHFLEKKRKLIKQMNPVIVTPSNWLAEIVKKTPVFQDMQIEVIPNSIDTSAYINIPKKTARRRLNLPLDGFYLLFGVENAFEKRKGVHLLISALKHCMEDPIFSQKVTTGEIKIICFGDPEKWVNDLNLHITPLGKIKSEIDLSTVYSLADAFLLPSVEDNLPNMVIEAMSCGTPTVAFNIGGIPEMIQNGVNGCIVEKGSESDYAKMILNLMNNPGLCLQMSENCRTIALNKFSLEVQAKKYLELYASLLPENNKIGEPDFSMIKQDCELLPDASDIDDDTNLFEIIKEIACKTLVSKEIELRLTKQDNDSRYQQINELTKLLHESEADRSARLDQINELTKLLHESEADRSARLDQINELTRLLQESEADRSARLDQINELTRLLQESEADRSARLDQINELKKLLNDEKKR